MIKKFLPPLLAAAMSGWLHAAAPGNPGPNIVVIFTDDQGYADVGKFGAEGFTTPNLDRMAEQGAVFRNFHVAQPVCSASRAALLTGCYPNRLGIHGALGPHTKVGISDGETTLAQLLQQHGYATGMFGKWHLGDSPQFMPTRHGFEVFFGLPMSVDYWPGHPDLITNFPPNLVAAKRAMPNLPIYDGEKVFHPEMTIDDLNHLTTWYTERAVRFIEQNKTRPFFLYVAHSMPHVPLGVSDKFRGKTQRGLYGDVIEEIDWSVGQILNTLQRNGLEQNTWVIFTSDNGPWLCYGNHAGSAKPLREGKGTNWEGGTREPCIMRWPGHIPAGADTWDMLMTIDLFPTIAKLIGAELPKHKIDGLDVWPIISRQPGAKNPHTSYWFYYEVNQLQAVTSGDGRWKLQLPHTYTTLAGQPGGRDGVPVPYSHRQVEHAELYDLVNDIGEHTDVSAQHPELVQQLEAEAGQARADLGDALTKQPGPGRREPGRLPESAVAAPASTKGPAVFMIGDSTMADKPLSPAQPERGWGQLLPLYLKDAVPVENLAVNGRSSKSFRDEGRWLPVLEKLRPGDYVIIQFGHNDEKREDPKRYTEAFGSFKQNLERYVREVREKQARPILATPVSRRSFNGDEVRDTHGDYAVAVRQVAAEEKVPLLDLQQRSAELLTKLGPELSKKLYMWVAPGEFAALPDGKQDDTHFNAYGASRICDLAVAEIKTTVPDLVHWLRAAP